jgi:hypothetical protein
MKVLALLLLALGASCGTPQRSWGSGASDLHPPALPPGVSVPKWDHFCADSKLLGHLPEFSRFLDEASENGWELVIWDELMCFKRPRVHPPTAPASP